MQLLFVRTSCGDPCGNHKSRTPTRHFKLAVRIASFARSFEFAAQADGQANCARPCRNRIESRVAQSLVNHQLCCESFCSFRTSPGASGLVIPKKIKDIILCCASFIVNINEKLSEIPTACALEYFWYVNIIIIRFISGQCALSKFRWRTYG